MNITGPIPEHIRRLMPKEDRDAIGKPAATIPEITERNGLKLEKEIQAEITSYLTLNDVPFFHQRTDKKTRGIVGWPDISAVVNGRAVFFEVKRPGEAPRPEQMKIIMKLIMAGAIVRVVHSSSEAIAAFHEIDYATTTTNEDRNQTATPTDPQA